MRRCLAVRLTSSTGHIFLSDHLSPGSVVVDLGMNQGHFSREISRVFRSRIVGLEPDPALFAALPSLPRVTAEQAAVNANGESVTLFLNGHESSTIVPTLAHAGVESVEVPGTTLADLLWRHGIERAALVKLDIEGAEIALLDTIDVATLSRIDQFTVEFHDWIDPSQAPGVARVKHRLRNEGFACLRLASNNADVLFVNRAQIRFTWLHRLCLVTRYKYPPAIARLTRRLLRRPAPFT